uniref:NADH dehydrogenase subunit 6 n=1 Tax=Xenobates singaporensis TaxID=3081716 RepID=A0AB38Z6W4_9HEMI|nr:NADH dehydrogenase subunit 6 [Xenobates singaporensis]WPW47188.1 NADH dehydrogenase subunit 6 [Xenobates singaporensis]
MKMILLMIITMSTIIIFMNHPLSMGFIIIIQTTLMSMLINMMMKYPWYSYILILTMLGGMLILFMYMASIASNEIMKFSSKIMILTIITFMVMAMIMKNEIIIMNYQNLMIMENQQNMSLMKLFNNKSSMLTIIMAMYLLMTMIYVIFMINTFEGPMRKKN